MRKKPVRNCPICANSGVDIIKQQSFVLPEENRLAAGYDLVCCVHCGFVYADINPIQNDYNNFYAFQSAYENKKASTGGILRDWDVQRMEETSKYLTNIWPGKNLSIVDVGCANGGLLYQLKKAGYKNICGVDPSALCVNNTKELGIDAFAGSLSAMPGIIDLSDRLILSHVLEHVVDLPKAIGSVRNCLKENGQVYLELPNAARYAEYVLSPFQELNTEHINHFSTLACANLMNSQGFVNMDQGERYIKLNSNKKYPVIYSVWLKGAVPEKTTNFQKDEMLKLQMELYISRSQKLFNSLRLKIKNITTLHKKMLIWGTGQLLMKLLADTELKHADIGAFIDGNHVHWGNHINGIRILSPESIADWNCPILITSIIHQEEIATEIRNRGFANEVILL